MTREEGNLYRSTGAVVNKRNRISWGAIIAGAIIAIVTQITLTILGLGIGIGTINPMSANPAEGLGVGSAIWFFVSNLISLFIGGYVASRLAGSFRTLESILHGVVTWGVYSLFSFYLLTATVGTVLGTAGNIAGTAMESVGQGLSLSSEDLQRLQQEGEEAAAQAEAEAQNQTDQQTSQQLRSYGQDAKQAASTAGILSGVALVLGAIVAGLGGMVGKPYDLSTETERRGHAK